MTLQDIVRILNLNPLWKEASEDEKVTAINQYLNDIEVSTLLNGTDATNYGKQVDEYRNVTYKFLNETLCLELTEEQILSLFLFTVIDLTNDNPLEVSIIDPINEKTFKLDYSVQFRNSLNILGEVTFAIIPTFGIKYKLQPQEQSELIMGIDCNATYKDDIIKLPSNTSPNFVLDYLTKFKVRDLSYPLTFDLDYSVTYLTF